MYNSVIVFDLDGTACDSSGRVRHARDGNWEEFYRGIEHDPPNEDVVSLLRDMRTAGKTLVCCTARDARYAAHQTRTWLYNNYLNDAVLLMRPDSNTGPSEELKPAMLCDWMNAHIGALPPQKLVHFILEDRDENVAAWRAAGFNCWQVRPGK